MPYVTLMQSPSHGRQVTLEELLTEYVDPSRFQPVSTVTSDTRTEFRTFLSQDFVSKFDITGMVLALDAFTMRYAGLFEAPREELYEHFEIPKRKIDPETGLRKMRQIDAPLPELKLALYDLKRILEVNCRALYHTSAFAYVPHRCAADAVRRHQANGSHWYLHTDFKDFFTNTTEEFAQNTLSNIFPFSEMVKYPAGKAALHKALSLCFLNGGLPTGTPISPMLTNLLMIPIDHKLANTLNNWNRQHFVYTRYADDIIISSKYGFDRDSMTEFINGTLSEFGAAFTLHPDKTRYQSNNGRNFHLGVIVNENNDITIGYKNKANFRAMVNEYLSCRESNVPWTLHEIQVLHGLLEYYSKIEPAYFKRYQERLYERRHIQLRQLLLEDLRAA